MKQATITRAMALVALLVTLGTPESVRSRHCPTLLRETSYTLQGTGIEDGNRWALLRYKNSEDELFSPGDVVDACFTVMAVTNNSIILQSRTSADIRTLFLSGYSSPRLETEGLRDSDGLVRAVLGYRTQPISKEIDTITYPEYSDNNTLPHSIYYNRRGNDFYNDLSAIGLGKDARPQSPDSPHRGVEIGSNSEKSLFGSLGLRRGDRIVAINGHFVTTPREVAEYLRAGGDAPIQISYSDDLNAGTVSTAAMVKPG